MHPVAMIALEYGTSLGYFSLAGRVLARSCKLMSSNQAVAGVALYAFINLKVMYADGRDLTLPNYFAHLLNHNYRGDSPYSQIKSRIITLAIATKVLALKHSEVWALFMISEIVIGLFERNDFFTDRQQKKACAGILINMGASYLLAKKFSMMSPGSAVSEALLISLVQLIFSRRISEISKEVYIDRRRRISWFGYKLFRALDRLALPISILIYSANAYSRGISPINIASLLSITTIGTQLLNRD